MSNLKNAIFDAKYVEMIGLADFIVKDCALPDVDADGNLVSGQQEIAAAIFRWAVMQRRAGDDVEHPEPVVRTTVATQQQGQNVAPMQTFAPAPEPFPMNTGFQSNEQG